MTSTASHAAPVASVVVPAYNEASVVGRCLTALREPGAPPLEIVVAANGCTDDTARVARSFPGVTVLDIPIGSKSGALDEGDAAATVFPRIYLDADITLGHSALLALIDALTTDEARVASPHVRFNTAPCSTAVRAFYDVYRELPYVRRGLIGLGVYGLSRTGRARFGRFPEVQADDLFVQRSFAPHERVVTDGEFVVQAPRDLRNLIRVRTRIARGNAELADSGIDTATGSETSTVATVRALFSLVRRRPRLVPGALVYVGVVVAARRAARRVGATAWHRDVSTR